MKHNLIVLNLLFLLTLSWSSLQLNSNSNGINYKFDSKVDNELSSMDESVTPIVFYHGMGDTAHGSIYGIQQFLESKLKGVYVYSIRMGNNTEEDFISSYLMNLNDQVTQACQLIKSDPRLANGYNAMGFSQGGQILRAIAQRCPEPPIINLFSFGGQHQGVYGLPRCPPNNQMCNLVRKLLNYGAYEDYIQKHLAQAEYWHDPIQESLYKQKSVFLADINNENIPRNPDYKERLLKLKNFVLVQYMNDSIVEPRETETFGFYKAGQSKEVYTLKESDLYNEDWIGLKVLDTTGRLHLYEVPGDHLQFDMKWFEEEIINKFLR